MDMIPPYSNTSEVRKAEQDALQRVADRQREEARRREEERKRTIAADIAIKNRSTSQTK